MEGHQSIRGSPVTKRFSEVQHTAKGGGQDRKEKKEYDVLCLRTYPYLGWGRQTGIKYSGHSMEYNTMKVRCRRTNIKGRSVLPARAVVRLLEPTMAEH